MIVLDAAAAVAVLLNVGPEAGLIRERISQPDETLHVPHLFEVEVLHDLRRHNLGGALPVARARLALNRSAKPGSSATLILCSSVGSGSCERILPPTTRPTLRSPRRSTRPWLRWMHAWRKHRATAPR